MIRAAQSTDARAITDLWNWMISDTLATFTTVEKTPQQIAVLITEREGLFLVAETPAGFAGFATCGPFRSGPGYAATCEHTVIVSPAAHGAGVGRDLVVHLEDAAKANGIRVLVAAISSANPPAIAFHKALGYFETGRMPQVGRKAGQWLDLILMQKNLAHCA